MINKCTREDDPLRGSQTYHLIASAKVEFYNSTEKQNFSRTFSRTTKNAWNPCVYR